MKAGAVTVLGGLTVIAAVTALYFWPPSVGNRCRALEMTASEVAASTDQAQVESVLDAAMERSNCLLEDLNRVIALHLPEPLATAEILITAPFKGNDIARWTELSSETGAVLDAASVRLREFETVSAEAAPEQ
jgi:hypothetical protein